MTKAQKVAGVYIGMVLLAFEVLAWPFAAYVTGAVVLVLSLCVAIDILSSEDGWDQ